MPVHQDAGMFGMYKVLPSAVEISTTNTTVEGEVDTAGAAVDSEDVDDDDDGYIDEEKESSATTATNENTPTILLFFPFVLSFSFYFL